MRAVDRDRAFALGKMIAEDLAIAMNRGADELEPEWSEFAEAVGLFAYSSGKLERLAATGALLEVVGRVPGGV